MIEFKYKITEDGDLVVCSDCGSDAPVAEFQKQSSLPKKNEAHDLCELCASTGFGALLEYNHNREFAPLASAIAQGLNLILDKCTDRLKDKPEGASS